MSIKELKRKEKKLRRDYLTEVAQDLFVNNEYDNVSMNDIADKAGFNKATLYNYFKNKEALYFAIILRGLKILVKMVKEESKKEVNGFEKLQLIGTANNKFAKKYPDCLRMLYSSQSNKWDKDNIDRSEEYKKVTELLKELILIMSDSIQCGVDDGTIRQDVNPMEAAVLISLISRSISNLGCVHQEALESRGIDRQKFSMDVKGFIHNMLKK